MKLNEVNTDLVERASIELGQDRKLGFVYFSCKKGARRGTLFVTKPARVRGARRVTVDISGGQSGEKKDVEMTVDPEDWVYVTLDDAGYCRVRVRFVEVQCENRMGVGRFVFEVQGADSVRGR